MDAIELITILERRKLEHLTKHADFERREEHALAKLHAVAFDSLDQVSTEFTESVGPEARELIDSINTLVIKEYSADLHRKASETQANSPADIGKDLQEALNAWFEE